MSAIRMHTRHHLGWTLLAAACALLLVAAAVGGQHRAAPRA